MDRNEQIITSNENEKKNETRKKRKEKKNNFTISYSGKVKFSLED